MEGAVWKRVFSGRAMAPRTTGTNISIEFFRLWNPGPVFERGEGIETRLNRSVSDGNDVEKSSTNQKIIVIAAGNVGGTLAKGHASRRRGKEPSLTTNHKSLTHNQRDFAVDNFCPRSLLKLWPEIFTFNP